MNRKWTFLLLLVTPALAVLACAPVDAPAPPAEEEAPAATPARPAEPTAATPAPETQDPPNGLRERVRAAVENVRKRDLRMSNAFWTVFHGILGLGPGVELVDDTTGARVRALDHI